MYIKVYVSEKEKQQLESIAAKRKVPLSKLCYDQIYPLFSNPLTGTLIFLEKSPMDEKCTESVTVHLTPTEHQTLIQKSGGIALSRYIRNMLFYDFKPITISIFTEDIALLSMTVSGYIREFHSFVAGLAIRQQLYEVDYRRLIQIANDTAIALRDVANHTYANRKSIRNTCNRILKSEIKRAVEKWISENESYQK